MTKIKYIEVDERFIPETARFDTPRRNQGQIVEVSYGVPRAENSEADIGDPYKRIVDHSDGSVRWYIRSDLERKLPT